MCWAHPEPMSGLSPQPPRGVSTITAPQTAQLRELTQKGEASHPSHTAPSQVAQHALPASRSSPSKGPRFSPSFLQGPVPSPTTPLRPLSFCRAGNSLTLPPLHQLLRTLPVSVQEPSRSLAKAAPWLVTGSWPITQGFCPTILPSYFLPCQVFFPPGSFSPA